MCGCMETILSLQVKSSMSSGSSQSFKSSGSLPIEELLVPLDITIVCKAFVLGRIVEWTDEGISWEADPRHAELIRKSFGVAGRSISTLGVKDRLDDIEGETPLGK